MDLLGKVSSPRQPEEFAAAAQTMSSNGADAPAEAQAAVDEPVMRPSVVDHVASLPLISSTCGMVNAAYTSPRRSTPTPGLCVV